MKLPALRQCSGTELKTGPKRQEPQNAFFPPNEPYFCPHFGPGNLPELVMAAPRPSSPRRWPVAGEMDAVGSSHRLLSQRRLLGRSALLNGAPSTGRCRWRPRPGTPRISGERLLPKDRQELHPEPFARRGRLGHSSWLPTVAP